MEAIYSIKHIHKAGIKILILPLDTLKLRSIKNVLKVMQKEV